MKKLLLAMACLSSPLFIHADSYTDILNKILHSNPALHAVSLHNDADKSENSAGLTLANPEVEFSYQWGSPTDVPDKKTLDVSQSFDFATLSGNRRKEAASLNRLSDASLAAQSQTVAAEIDKALTMSVYYYRLNNIYKESLDILTRMEALAKKSLEAGQMTSIDYNSILIQQRTMATDAELAAIERRDNTNNLSRLGGGIKIENLPDNYLAYTLPANFEEWSNLAWTSSAQYAEAAAEEDVARRRVALRKSEGLPDFSLGFTSEMVKSNNYYGVTVGVGLPLWANKGKVKAAKAGVAAAQAHLDDLRLATLADMHSRYEKAAAMEKALQQTKQILTDCDNTKDIDRMYDSGAISVHDYLTQLLALTDLKRKYVETERDYQLSLTELREISCYNFSNAR